MECVTEASPTTTARGQSPVDIARETEGPPSHRLIAILIANGVTDTAELATLTGLTIRSVQHVRNAIHCANAQSIAPKKRNPLRNAQPIAPENAIHCAETQSIAPRARVEDNSLFFENITISEKKDPLTPKTTRKPKAAKPDKPNINLLALEAFQSWNATALRCGLPQASRLTPDRVRMIGARLKDYGLDGWTQALANIERSSFLTGTNDRGWKASLDFLCQAKSFGKVHDGGYGNGRHTGPVVPIRSRMEIEAEIDAAIAGGGVQ